MREAGKARPNQFLGGIDGEPEAVAEIKSGGPYKTSVSLASPVFGYAMGQHAADWLEGKSIPQAMDILPKLLTSENMASYEADAVVNVRGGARRGSTYLDVTNVQLTFDLARIARWSGATAYLSTQRTHGGMPSEIVGSLPANTRLAR